MHRMLDAIMAVFSGSLSANLPYRARAVPIVMANAHGPSKSPIVLVMCRPFSANVLAHCDIACSDAPAQTIITISSQNTRLVSIRFIGICCASSGTIGYSGTKEKYTAFAIGTIIHRSVSTRQLAVPNAAKNSVESSTSATCPQQ